MNEKLKAAIILLLICVGGIVIPQIGGGIIDKDWADSLSFISVFGAIIAFVCVLIIMFQDVKGEDEEAKDEEPFDLF